MKKILIIAYFYPPCNGIAAYRPAAFANDFSIEHEVKVLTRQWEGNEKSWNDYLSSNEKPKTIENPNEKLAIIRIPYVSKIRKKNKLKTLFKLWRGEMETEIVLDDFFQEACELIENWTPDLILVSAPPNNLVTLASELNQKYAIPYIADFRDFENTITLNNSLKIPFRDRFIHRFIMKSMKRSLEKCSAIVGVNNEITSYLGKATGKPHKVIFNGYEQSIFGRFIPLENLKSELFHITLLGSIYPEHEYELFLGAFQKFIQNNPNPKIKFNFLGTDVIPEVGATIREAIPGEFLHLTNRIPRAQALEALEASHIVWKPEYIGLSGVYSGKIFEYLGAKRPIIIAPSTGDVLDKLLEETNAGKSFSTSDQITSYIQERYDEWLKNGYINYNGKSEAILFYSRENQSGILLEYISSLGL